MCGIWGIWHQDGFPIDPSIVQHAVTTLRHRGPDDEGYVLIQTQQRHVVPCGGKDTRPELSLPRIEDCAGGRFNLAFGFRRLAILDLSPAGHQPMSDPDQTLWVVLNGEVYNYVELRDELTALGHAFHTQTDTEALLHAYQQWGVDCLDRLNGMYGFALWDQQRGRLFCARDRLGVKPFYYYFDGAHFLFASELKALLVSPQLPRRPNPRAILDFLAYGRSDHTAETFLDGVNQVPPAHALVLDESGSLQVRRYWSAPSNPALTSNGRMPSPPVAEEMRQRFVQAVRLQLRSDVPVGTCLSGGLDSSSIVCVAQHLLDQAHASTRLHTFTSVVDDPRCDERAFVQSVTEATQTINHQVFPNADGFWNDVERVTWHQDEPFFSLSVYAQWCVMRCAREGGIVVLLDGQAADETQAGYEFYYARYLLDQLQTGRVSQAAVEGRAWASVTGQSSFQVAAALAAMWLDDLPALVRTRVRQSTRPWWDLIHPDVWQAGPPDPVDGTLLQARRQNVQSLLWADTHVERLPRLLRAEDRNAMAFSIEARVPFTDHRLVEYAFSLPADQKLRDGWSKYALRQAMAGILPEQIRWRRDKMGFFVTESDWLRQGRQRILDLFTGPGVRSQPWVRTAVLRDRVDAWFGQGLSSAIWPFVSLELWLRGFEL